MRRSKARCASDLRGLAHSVRSTCGELQRQLDVDHRGRLHAARCGRDRGLQARGQIAGRVHAGQRGLTSHRIDLDEPVFVERYSQRTHQLDLLLRRVSEQQLAFDTASVRELYGFGADPAAS